jgi:hypothetical protein
VSAPTGLSAPPAPQQEFCVIARAPCQDRADRRGRPLGRKGPLVPMA